MLPFHRGGDCRAAALLAPVMADWRWVGDGSIESGKSLLLNLAAWSQGPEIFFDPEGRKACGRIGADDGQSGLRACTERNPAKRGFFA